MSGTTLTDAEITGFLRQLVAQFGTPQLLRFVSDAAKQHAEDLLSRGARADAARLLREAKMLAKASDAITE